MARLRTWALVLALLLTGALSLAVLAADPQPYDVKFAPTGNSRLDAAPHDISSLISLQKTAPVGEFAPTERAWQDLGGFTPALDSFGCCKPRMVPTIDGRYLDAAGLADAIDHTTCPPPVPLEVRSERGPQFLAATVEFRQRIVRHYGAVAFIDAWHVSAGGEIAPFRPNRPRCSRGSTSPTTWERFIAVARPATQPPRGRRPRAAAHPRA